MPRRPLPKQSQTRPVFVDRVVWERLWSACGRKEYYASLVEAEDAATTQGLGLVPYLCPSGAGHWHLTSRRAEAD